MSCDAPESQLRPPERRQPRRERKSRGSLWSFGGSHRYGHETSARQETILIPCLVSAGDLGFGLHANARMLRSMVFPVGNATGPTDVSGIRSASVDDRGNASADLGDAHHYESALQLRRPVRVDFGEESFSALSERTVPPRWAFHWCLVGRRPFGRRISREPVRRNFATFFPPRAHLDPCVCPGQR